MHHGIAPADFLGAEGATPVVCALSTKNGLCCTVRPFEGARCAGVQWCYTGVASVLPFEFDIGLNRCSCLIVMSFFAVFFFICDTGRRYRCAFFSPAIGAISAATRSLGLFVGRPSGGAACFPDYHVKMKREAKEGEKDHRSAGDALVFRGRGEEKLCSEGNIISPNEAAVFYADISFSFCTPPRSHSPLKPGVDGAGRGGGIQDVTRMPPGGEEPTTRKNDNAMPAPSHSPSS